MNEKEESGSKFKQITNLITVHSNLLAIQIIWGAFAVTSKWALSEGEYVPPLLFSSLRFLTALPFMLIATIIETKSILQLIPQEKSHWFQFLLLGIIGVGLPQQVYIYGLHMTTASNAAVLGILSPAWTMLFSLLAKREKFVWLKLVGIVLSIAGAMIVVDPTSFRLSSDSVGDLLVIIMTILFGVYIVYSDYLCSKIESSQQIAFWAFFFGTIFVCLSSMIMQPKKWLEIHHIPLDVWWSILYAGIFATAFCYGMMNWCLKRSSPITAMAYEPFQPLTAAILASMFLGESLTVFFVFGGIVVIFGLFFVLAGRYREVQLRNAENSKSDYIEICDY